MWSYFTHKDMPYSLRKGPTFGLPKTRLFYYGTNTAQFIFVVLSYAIILLLLQSPAIHYLNSKIKLKTLEILIGDV